MAYYQRKQDVNEIAAGNGHGSFPLLGEKQGCTNGCCAGISYYSRTEYTPPAVHEDQEGFMVLSGQGWAKIGEEEFFVEPDEERGQRGTPHPVLVPCPALSGYIH